MAFTIKWFMESGSSNYIYEQKYLEYQEKLEKLLQSEKWLMLFVPIFKKGLQSDQKILSSKSAINN